MSSHHIAKGTLLVIYAAYTAWLVFLASLFFPFRFQAGHGYETAKSALDAVHGMVERHALAHGEYPSTQRVWMLIADGASQDVAGTDITELLRHAQPFSNPKTTPPTSIIYSSDGKDYKLIAHTADRSFCVQARHEAPTTVDMARVEYTTGFLRGPSWPVTNSGEQQGAVWLINARAATAPVVDPSLGQNIRGTCWAFGYWSPGAALW